MRALVVYESMYGNTHTVADHIARGLSTECEVDNVAVASATTELVASADLVVVGGPTHVHTMSRPTSRRAAVEAAEKDPELDLDPDAEGPGLRDWLAGLGDIEDRPAAAFDTRIDAAAALTGRASKAIARQLKRHGFHLMIEPESFLVDKQNHLVEGEADRARAWGRGLAVAMTTRLQTS